MRAPEIMLECLDSQGLLGAHTVNPLLYRGVYCYGLILARTRTSQTDAFVEVFGISCRTCVFLVILMPPAMTIQMTSKLATLQVVMSENPIWDMWVQIRADAQYKNKISSILKMFN